MQVLLIQTVGSLRPLRTVEVPGHSKLTSAAAQLARSMWMRKDKVASNEVTVASADTMYLVTDSCTKRIWSRNEHN